MPLPRTLNAQDSELDAQHKSHCREELRKARQQTTESLKAAAVSEQLEEQQIGYLSELLQAEGDFEGDEVIQLYLPPVHLVRGLRGHLRRCVRLHFARVAFLPGWGLRLPTGYLPAPSHGAPSVSSTSHQD